jgi:hypothetical protein
METMHLYLKYGMMTAVKYAQKRNGISGGSAAFTVISIVHAQNGDHPTLLIVWNDDCGQIRSKSFKNATGVPVKCSLYC